MRYFSYSMIPNVKICFSCSVRKVKKELKRLKVSHSLISNSDGQTITIYNSGRTIIIVLIRKRKPRKFSDENSQKALVVHEAVHVFDGLMESIGESHPGSEIKAYFIQRLSQDFFQEYDNAK